MEALLAQLGRSADKIETGSSHRKSGECELDTVKQQLRTPKDSYPLSYKETELLILLFSHRNIFLERQVPLLKMWGDDSFYNARSMDVFMSHLRKMLKDDPSLHLSIRGAGYKLIF
ncbi:winged helix-turn-helix domain-containing protein [Pedobacter miscanthi]|uniref:winged helix-turn-helix domain-containing protein n=1 Tax=Pedobacter miscanthi TaxID=2259170 RepID=UPI00293032BA|nr:winged helix-turn-helix domain-containing protein [Pedobacter miscanthi]